MQLYKLENFGTPLKRVHISLHRHPSQQSAHFIAPAPLSKECTVAFTQLTLSKVWISQKTDQIRTKIRNCQKIFPIVWFWRLPLRRCQKNFYCWFLAPYLPRAILSFIHFLYKIILKISFLGDFYNSGNSKYVSNSQKHRRVNNWCFAFHLFLYKT